MTACPKVFVSIVTFNSASVIGTCLASLRNLVGYEIGNNLSVVVIDNASSDESLARCSEAKASCISNLQNLGFAGAQNQGVFKFLESDSKYLLILNPDVRLSRESLQTLALSLEADDSAGLATPLLLRADGRLEPILPETIDAAGMILNSSLRHLDFGSESSLSDKFLQPACVFGGTGACLLMSRKCVESLVLDGGSAELDVGRIYPQLLDNRNQRALLFDEAFFAYREDADLCWRAQLLGWKCRYVPAARAYHQRVVTPERRGQLSSQINAWGVRNRFLLQINNYFYSDFPAAFLSGILLRNILVVFGVLLTELKSLVAFRDLIFLFRRALFRRLELKKRRLQLVRSSRPIFNTRDTR